MSKTKLFLQLEAELKPYKKIMSEASDIIMDKEVSKYPIMVLHQQEVEIGIPILKKSEQIKWSIHASTLEEFVSKQIIFEEKVQDFIVHFKDPEEFLCLFVLSELGAQYIFLPREK